MGRILITGAKGQLGREVQRQLSCLDKYDLMLTDFDELDITEMDKVWECFNEVPIDVVINCAAHTAVDQCETDINSAYKINAIGARNLAIAANEKGAKIVHISTDYVFDGNGIINADGYVRPYNEFDTPNPQTVYGRTKLEGERFVAAMNPRHYIIRTAWLYGKGNNFVRTMINLSKEQKSLRVVNDQFGSPTSTEEVGKMILELIDSYNYGLFHGTCEGYCSWYDFTKAIFAVKDIDTKVIPVTSDEYTRPAKRPKYSVLDNNMLSLTSGLKFKYWTEALETYLSQ